MGKPTELPKFGKRSRRYVFFLNPYTDARFTSCPKCGRKTRQKKLPLAIHVDKGGLIALNKTCRHCPGCELLIAHQDEIESNLASLFDTLAPEVIGNDYLVVGTLDRPNWKRGVLGQTTLEQTIGSLLDFKDMVRFELSRGWVRDDT